MRGILISLGICLFPLTLMASPDVAKKPRVNSHEEAGECGSITPRTLAYVCDRFQTSSGTVQCFQAGKDAYLSQCGMGVCDRYQTENGTIGCIRAIRNKEFDVSALEACDRITTEQATTECLVAIGSPHGGTISIDEIRREVRSALYDVEDGYYREAERTLRRLLRALEDEPPTPN